MGIEARLVRSDLPATHRKPITQALVELYKRNVVDSKDKKNKNAKRADFARAMKASLDTSFGTHWHVLVGERLGFACKKRNETMGMWKIDDTMIVIWQSPGIEPPEEEGAPTPWAAPAPGAPAAEADVASSGKQAPKVLEPPPEEIQTGSDVAKVAELVCEEMARQHDDTQLMALDIRRQLTSEFGTIWHVVAGSDFVLEAAEDRRNHVLVTTGRTRLVCFQHEQFKGGFKIDWDKLFTAMPYFVLAFICFSFMTMGAICRDAEPDPRSPFRAMLHRRVCGENAEDNLQYYGGGALIVMFIIRRAFKTTKAARTKAANKASNAAAAEVCKSKPE
mmetsp:Transcript_57627/g.166862  ORF Transcript_57627/g.166862 Transcript_57627/m.166862 type:complete len:334 (-) Transcript_57627:113-1114(-)